MKGKITIVFLSLVLVFGMIAASCDNGGYPAVPYPTQDENNTKAASDWDYSFASPYANKLFKQTPGMTTGISTQGAASFAGDVISFTKAGGLLILETGAKTSTDTITIKYIVKLKSGTDARLVLKDGGWNNSSTCTDADRYQDLVNGPATDLELKASWFPTPAKISFQFNEWPVKGEFQMKIISVTCKDAPPTTP
jgi:hypothetical protein